MSDTHPLKARLGRALTLAVVLALVLTSTTAVVSGMSRERAVANGSAATSLGAGADVMATATRRPRGATAPPVQPTATATPPRAATTAVVTSTPTRPAATVTTPPRVTATATRRVSATSTTPPRVTATTRPASTATARATATATPRITATTRATATPRATATTTAPASGQNYGCPSGEELVMLRLINDFRARNGVGPLTLSPTLTNAAEFHSRDMAARNYFSHDLPGIGTWADNIRNHGYTGNGIGENIAAGYADAARTVQQWIDSPGHRANMLNANFRAIGIGGAYGAGSTYGTYWTNTFGYTVDSALNC